MHNSPFPQSLQSRSRVGTRQHEKTTIVGGFLVFHDHFFVLCVQMRVFHGWMCDKIILLLFLEEEFVVLITKRLSVYDSYE